MKEILTMLLLLHVLGDFFFLHQSKIENRYHKIKALLVHLGMHLLLAVVGSTIFWFNDDILSLFMLNFVAHSLIDTTIFVISKKSKIQSEWIYGFDQMTHLFVIFVGTYILVSNDLIQLEFILNFQNEIWVFVSLITGFLYLLRPANYTFKKYFQKYNKSQYSSEIPNAGGHIGSIERLVMLILLTMGAEIALGIVLTAKTLTRFDEITNDKAFAQYYLLGTLYSILCTLLVYGILNLV